MSRATRRTHDWQWHQDRMAEGPRLSFGGREVKDWDRLNRIMTDLMRKWEEWPEYRRLGYAFPNPEDRGVNP
jgi:hypothetical protein